MPTRSAKLWQGVSLPAATAVLLYTCPADKTVLVKSVVLANATTSPVRIIMSSLGTATPADRLAADLAASETRQVPVWWVLEPGDVVRALCAAGSTGVRVAGYGAELPNLP